eukprot:gene8144-biopygen12115
MSHHFHIFPYAIHPPSSENPKCEGIHLFPSGGNVQTRPCPPGPVPSRPDQTKVDKTAATETVLLPHLSLATPPGLLHKQAAFRSIHTPRLLQAQGSQDTGAGAARAVGNHWLGWRGLLAIIGSGDAGAGMGLSCDTRVMSNLAGVSPSLRTVMVWKDVSPTLTDGKTTCSCDRETRLGTRPCLHMLSCGTRPQPSLQRCRGGGRAALPSHARTPRLPRVGWGDARMPTFRARSTLQTAPQRVRGRVPFLQTFVLLSRQLARICALGTSQWPHRQPLPGCPNPVPLAPAICNSGAHPGARRGGAAGPQRLIPGGAAPNAPVLGPSAPLLPPPGSPVLPPPGAHVLPPPGAHVHPPPGDHRKPSQRAGGREEALPASG